jgi:hypothetical protein
MFKLDRMHGEQGAAALRIPGLAMAVVDLQNRMDQLETWRKDPSGMQMRNLVQDRLTRVHRKLAARLQNAEAIVRGNLRPTAALSGEKMYDVHRENVLDQSLAETFPASDAVSIAQPGGGVDTSAAQLAAFEQVTVRKPDRTVA